MSARRLVPAILLALALGTGAASAQRELHWKSLDVKARLDADGRLHVVERHAMVFTGDWNGGERRFRTATGQVLTLQGIKRFDPSSGVSRDVLPGSLDEVDRYRFTDPTTLRWRSRLPSDPEFSKTEIGYELSYLLGGVLIRQGDTYVLDHDFAFPDRTGRIEAFSLTLDLDPVWAPPPDFRGRYEAKSLVPGEGYVVRARLANRGARRPDAVRAGTSRATRTAIFGLFLAAVSGIAVAFWRRESALGRFAPLAPPEAIDDAWLRKHLFSLLPEEAGALWDDKVGAPEVAAVLARLSSEGNLETRAEGKELTLKLKRPIEQFQDYEKELLAGLFFGKKTETSTSEIRAHYKSRGFDPASKIQPGLERRLAAHKDFQDRSGRPARWPTALLIVSGVALTTLALLRERIDPGQLVGFLIWNGILWGAGGITALFYQKRMHRLGLFSLSFLFVPLFFLWRGLAGLGSGGTAPLELLVGQLLVQLGIVNSLFNAARTRQGPAKIARRKQLLSARGFFEKELSQRHPKLDDAWFPWIVAFGMGPSVDRWFRSFGGTAVERSTSPSSSSTSSGAGSSGGASSSWTGGGGFSGGAGSSGAWAVAAGSLAAGVATPGSSSGGGGGGGGGGSSGGGGGGGW